MTPEDIPPELKEIFDRVTGKSYSKSGGTFMEALAQILTEHEATMRHRISSQIGSTIGYAQYNGADERVIEGLRWAVAITSDRSGKRKSPSGRVSGNRHVITLAELYERDKGVCYLCKKEIPYEMATREHVIPVARGGQNRAWNIKLACAPCNTAKADRDIDTVIR